MNPHGRAPVDPVARFATAFDIDEETGCWNWVKGLCNGYARISVNGRTVHAYRWIYEWIHGPVAPGLVVDHICNNRRCVNPDHLQAISYSENYRRAIPLRTHCPNGHELTPENTYTSGMHKQKCYQCARNWIAARRAQQRVAA